MHSDLSNECCRDKQVMNGVISSFPCISQSIKDLQIPYFCHIIMWLQGEQPLMLEAAADAMKKINQQQQLEMVVGVLVSLLIQSGKKPNPWKQPKIDLADPARTPPCTQVKG